MRTVYITFTYSTFRLFFEDDILAVNFATTFQASPTSAKIGVHYIDVIGNGATNYSIFLNGLLIQEAVLRSEVVYYITRVFGETICAGARGAICVFHAASTIIRGNRIVSFFGSSGSGKTTLSLYFSKYGYFIGDEYAYIDLNTGFLWHEQHPFQLKKSNATSILDDLSSPAVLAVQGFPFGQAYYASLAFTNHKTVKHSDRIKVKVMVLPRYDSSIEDTRICKLRISELPSVVLQSLMGESTPSILFKRFIQMASSEHVQFYEVKFSDGIDAAKQLFSQIK